jgi:class 3 adenylate cyclase
VVDVPETRFAVSADGIHLAYQVFAEGPLTLVFLPLGNTLIDLLWQEPGIVRTARRLGGFARVVWYDSRGVGASGGEFRDCLVEETADADLEAILDAVGCEQVVPVGSGVGAEPIRYTANHPERVRALILINTCAYYVREDDYPWGIPSEDLDSYFDAAKAMWGTGTSVALLSPSKANDPAFREWWAKTERLGHGLDEGAALLRAAFERDLRPLLPKIKVPTLVLHRTGTRMIRVGAGRYLAEHIPGAQYVELPGEDQPYYVGDTDELCDEIEEFLTGGRAAPEGDVVTATVSFTDIVASTEQAARLGHRKWQTVHETHDTMVRTCLDRYRGREIKTIGDGFLATFDATSRAVRAAIDIVTQAKHIGLDVRSGVHTGEVEVRPDDVVGLPVTITKRICDLANAGEVLVSGTVKDLVIGSGIEFTNRGEYELKGVPGAWKLFAVAI